MLMTLKKILHWNINNHALTLCVLYCHEVHFYTYFKSAQNDIKVHKK